MDEGGDAACWLHQLCGECGAVTVPGRPHDCGSRLAPEDSPDAPAADSSSATHSPSTATEGDDSGA